MSQQVCDCCKGTLFITVQAAEAIEKNVILRSIIGKLHWQPKTIWICLQCIRTMTQTALQAFESGISQETKDTLAQIAQKSNPN